MKIALYKTSGFILLILCTLFLMEIFIRQIPNEYKLKRNYLDNYSDSIEVLFLGSSEIHTGLNPEYTSKRSFNAAHPAQTMDYCYALLDKYKNDWGRLEYIVLEISYPMLYMKMEDSNEAWRVKNYNIYYGIHLSTKLKSNTEILNGRLFDHIVRLFKNYVKGIDEIFCSDLGWYISSDIESPEFLCQHGKIAAEDHTISPEYQRFYEMRSALDSIIEFSQKNECQIVMCTPPVYKAYSENVNKSQMDSILSTMAEIIEKHSNCSYINLMDSKIFKDQDFFNSNHLNDKGAKKLTQIIDSLITMSVTRSGL